MAAYDNAEMPRAPTQYGPPLANFGAQIASLPDSYYQGAEAKRDYDLKRAFQGGIPRDANGGIDYSGMADTLARKGGVDQAIGVANTGAQLEASKNFSGMMSGQPQQQPRPTAPVFAPPPDQTRPQVASAAQGNNGGDTVRSVMTEAFGGRDVSAAIPRLAQSIGVEADAPLSPQQVAQLKQRLQPGQDRMQPQQAPQAAPQPQQAQPQQQASTIPPALAGLIPANWPGTVQSFRDRIAAAATSPMLPPASQKVAQERLKAIDAAIAKDAERTGEQKNAVDPSVAQAAGNVELEKKVADAQGKVIGGAIDAGQSAHKRIQSLAVMKDALSRGEGSMTTGPFAEYSLKAKQVISSLFGIDVEGKTEAEVTQKIGFQLATQAVKEISQRPTQFEFAKALQNLPGLELSPTGSKFIIDVMGQSARHDIELSKLAQRRENWANWPEVQDKFYQTHPIMSPFDRKVPLSEKDLSVLSAGAPPTAAAAGTPQQQAAPAPGQATITNAKTGQKMTLSPDGTSWVPMK